MISKRIIAAAAAITVTVTTSASCGTSISNNEQIKKNKGGDKNAVTELDSAVDSQLDDSSADGLQNEPVLYEETEFEAVDVPYVEYSKTYQAESGTLIGSGASVLKERANFKGEGYVNGATQDNWSLSFDLPESQFYNITVSTASDKGVNGQLYVNGKAVWIFRTAGDGTFVEKKLENIWLEEGINEIKISSTENQVDVDYVTIEANNDISSLQPDLSASALSNPNANFRSQAVYQLLCSDYGKQVLTAQHVTAGSSQETDAVAQLTGKYPAIRVSDIGGYTKGDPKDTDAAQKYFKQGGLVAYDWYWADPSDKDKKSTAIEIKDVSFDLRKAMPEEVEVKDDSSSDTDSSQAADDTASTDTTGYDDGTGYYDDDTGYYDDGTGYYDDGTGYYDDGTAMYSASGLFSFGSADSYPDDLNEDQQSAGSQAAAITSDGRETTTTDKIIDKKPKYSIDEISMWTKKQYTKLYKNKDISEELYLILNDIDAAAKPLSELQDKNVPVIFRPLPVASNGLYWWGIDKDAYKWLWKVMYSRMTDYHKLNNLVWVWSAQNADWYVGDEYCDVLSADIYTDGNRDAQINTLLFLNNISKTKPLGLSECGVLPAMESILSEKAFWSYTALWNEPYLGAETGITIDDENSAKQAAARFIEYYNNNFTVTLEELPSIPDVAKSIRDKKKQAKSENKSDKKSDSKADKKSDSKTDSKTDSKSDKKSDS